MKLTLFLSAGAVVALMGILLIYKFSGLNTFDILVLREKAQIHGTLATVIWLLIFSGLPRSRRSGRCTPGRRSAMPRRRPPPACCTRAC